MISTLLAALVLVAAPAKMTGPGKALVGAWYQGDTQYLELKADGTGLLGVVEISWKVDRPENIHLTFKEDGAEKDLRYVFAKGGVLKLGVETSEIELKRGKAKIRPTVKSEAEAAAAKDKKKPVKKGK